MMNKKLKVKKKEFEQNRDNFKLFYSCGPFESSDLNEKNLNRPIRNAWITNDVKTNAAIIIQKNYKMFHAKKQFDLLQEEEILSKAKRQKHKIIPIKSSEQQKQLQQQIKETLKKNSKRRSINYDYQNIKGVIGCVNPHSPKNIRYNLTDGMTRYDKHQLLAMSTKHKNQLAGQIRNSLLLERRVADSVSTRVETQSFPISPPAKEVQSYLLQDFSSYVCKIPPTKPVNLIETYSQQKSRQPSYSVSLSVSSDESKEKIISPKTSPHQSLPTPRERRVFSPLDLLEFPEQIQQFIKKQQIQATSPKKKSLSMKEEQERNKKKHLELIKQRIYKSSLLLKQDKLLQIALRNQFSLIKNIGFHLDKADVNCKDKNGNIQRIQQTMEGIYKFLIKLFHWTIQVQLCLQNNLISICKIGNSALYYAVNHKNYEFVKYLLQMGLNVNEICENGSTPLHMAFKIEDEQIIMDFMDQGGDLNIVNNEKQTPLALASVKFIKQIGLEKGTTHINHLQNIKSERNILRPSQNLIETAEPKYQYIHDNNALYKNVYKSKKDFFQMRMFSAHKRVQDQALDREIVEDIKNISQTIQFKSKTGYLSRFSPRNPQLNIAS